jgi:replicative DNA helicase
VTRTPPHDIAAEQAVIGSALLAPRLIAELARVVQPEDFYRPVHAELWRVLTRLRAAGEPGDLIAVAAHLADLGSIGRLGGVPYLHTLIAAVPTTANGPHYARIVAEHARRREVADLGSRLTQLAGSGADTGDVLAAGRALLDSVPVQAWPDPMPLSARRAPATFPIDALPSWVADMAGAVAEFTQTPADLAGCIALAALSTAAGGRAEVEIRGSWHEPANLFTVVVLPPGSRKSAVFTALIRPLLAAEAVLIERTRPAIVEAELALRVAAKAADRAANAAAAAVDAGGRDRLLADATAAAMAAETITVPSLPCLVADDVTSEQAASLLAEQGGRLAVLSPEGGIFATLAGRYSGAPNLEVFLKGHAGDMLRVDRRSRPAEHVDRPALTLGLAVQPEVLRDIAQMPGFRGKGLLARILFAVPENTVGRRRIGAEPIPATVADAYAERLTALVVGLAGLDEPAVMPLSPEANDRMLTIERDTEPRLAPSGTWAHIVDWGSKYAGAVARIAGLLHLAEHLPHGPGGVIEAGTFDRAATIGAYFAEHALTAFDDMGADPLVDDARHVLAWIERSQTERFTKRDLFTALSRGRFRKAADLDPVLNLLVAHGYLRSAPAPERRGAGRAPSPGWLVHPEVLRPAGTVQPITAGRVS